LWVVGKKSRGKIGIGEEDYVQENFDKRDKKAQITFPLRHFYPLKVVK
jgi:hypothetical protein